MSDLIGMLTAVKGTAIAMTVVNVNDEMDGKYIECVHIVKGLPAHFSAQEDAFIGFGDTLVYSNGAFIDAYSVNGDDDDEDEELEDEDDLEDEDEDDEEPANHLALKN